MIEPGKLKPFILSPNEWTRFEVISYFKDAWISDPDIWPLVLQACDRYGLDDNRLLMVHSDFQPMNPEVLSALIDLLKKTDDTNTAWILSRVISKASIEFLRDFLPELRPIERMEPFTQRIDRRIKASKMSAEELWNEVQDFARQNEKIQYIDEMDYGYAEDLIEFLAPCDLPDDETLCRLLEKNTEAEESEESILEFFLIDLAGIRKIEAAVPFLVDRFKLDADALLEHCNDALARIGSPRAVERVRDAFASQSWDYQNFASAVFANIKCVESEEAILALRKEKNIEPDIQERLCLCLCQQFSLQAIEWGRHWVAQGKGWEFNDFRENLLALAEVQGVDLPEAEEWTRALKIKKDLYRRRRDSLLEVTEETGVPWQPLPEEPRTLLMEPDPMVLTSGGKKKIGANAPCPCGSGKKYKKCCGRQR